MFVNTAGQFTDTYRLKLFRNILDREHEQILSPEDQKAYRRVDNLYSLGFWSCVASIPVNFYFGIQIGKVPAQAKQFMMKSLAYTTFSTVLFAMSLFRYQALSKELSTRYLTQMSNSEMECYLNEMKAGVYQPQPTQH